MSISKKQKPAASVLFSETPPPGGGGRSRRKSTMLVTTATRSALLQSSSPTVHTSKPNCVEDTRDDSSKFFEINDTDENVFNTEQINAPQPKSILKTKRNLPILLLPREDDTLVTKGFSLALNTPVLVRGGSSVTLGREPRNGSSANLDLSGICLLTPEIRSTKKKEDKRRSRRSNVSREQFLSFVFSKEPSPNNSPERPPKQDLEILCHDSDSSDDDWEALTNSDGSVIKSLLKSNEKRKSLVISGNIKSSTKLQLSGLKSQTNKNSLMKVIDTVDNEISFKTDHLKPNTTSKSNITRPKRKPRHRTVVEELFPNNPEVAHVKQVGSSVTILPPSNITIDRERDNGIKPPSSIQDSFATVVEVAKSNESLHSIETFKSSKRKCEELPIVNSKKSKSDPIILPKSPFPSKLLLQQMTSCPQLKGCEKTSLTPQPIKIDTPSSVRLSGRESPRISTVSTNSAIPSPMLSRCPTDPMIPKIDPRTITTFVPIEKASILAGVVVFVDFRAEHENRGNVIKNAARELGANVVDKIFSEVTHVIFKDGSRINYEKAKKSGIPIVSAGWLEESKNQGRKMPEIDFPSVSIEKYDSPGLFPKTMKKMKSMQPKTIDEDFDAASKAQDKKQKMMDKKLMKEKEVKKLRSSGSRPKYPPHEHYFKGSPYNTTKKSKPNLDSSLAGVLQEFQTPTGTPVKLQKLPTHLLSPTSPSDGDYDTPLARRLANRYQSPGVQRNILNTSTSMPATPRPEDSALVTSNLDTTQEFRKTNSKSCNKAINIPVIVVEKESPSNPGNKLVKTLDVTPVARRSRRSKTAFSTLAISKAVAQEVRKKETEVSQDHSVKEFSGPGFTREMGINPAKLESTRINPKIVTKKSKFQTPFKATTTYNSTPAQVKPRVSPRILEKQKNFVLASSKENAKGRTENPTVKNIKKTPRALDPCWNHSNDNDKASTVASNSESHEFSGFDNSYDKNKQEPVKAVQTKKNGESQKTCNSSLSHPSRVKMFLVAPQNSGGVKRKMEHHSASGAQEEDNADHEGQIFTPNKKLRL